MATATRQRTMADYQAWTRAQRLSARTHPMGITPEVAPTGLSRTDITETAHTLSDVLPIVATDLQAIMGYWRKRLPPDYVSDGLQDIVETWMVERPSTAVEAFGIARHVVSHLWGRWHTRQHYSIPDSIPVGERWTCNCPRCRGDGDGLKRAGERYIGKVVGSIEALAVSRLNVREIWSLLPTDWQGYNIRDMVARRLQGENLRKEARVLRQWASLHADKLQAIAAS